MLTNNLNFSGHGEGCAELMVEAIVVVKDLQEYLETGKGMLPKEKTRKKVKEEGTDA